MFIRRLHLSLIVINILVEYSFGQNETTEQILEPNKYTSSISLKENSPLANSSNEIIYDAHQIQTDSINGIRQRVKRRSRQKKKAAQEEEEYAVEYHVKFAFQNEDEQGQRIKYNKSEGVYYSPAESTKETLCTPSDAPQPVCPPKPTPEPKTPTSEGCDQNSSGCSDANATVCWDSEGRRMAINDVLSVPGECRNVICRGNNKWEPFYKCDPSACNINYTIDFPECCSCLSELDTPRQPRDAAEPCSAELHVHCFHHNKNMDPTPTCAPTTPPPTTKVPCKTDSSKQRVTVVQKPTTCAPPTTTCAPPTTTCAPPTRPPMTTTPPTKICSTKAPCNDNNSKIPQEKEEPPQNCNNQLIMECELKAPSEDASSQDAQPAPDDEDCETCHRHHRRHRHHRKNSKSKKYQKSTAARAFAKSIH